MIKLSERLKMIADHVAPGEKVADIGTDHAKLPIYLWMAHVSPYVVLSDLREGPLDKAKTMAREYVPGHAFDMRLGSGLETLETGEVDTVVIAGMGGLLTKAILSTDPAKSASFKKYILQPRNGSDKLREWLQGNRFQIADESLVREGRHLCEIIVAHPTSSVHQAPIEPNNEMDLDFEISPLLFAKADPLLPEFIKRKIGAEIKALEFITKAAEARELTEATLEKRVKIERRLELLKQLLQRAEHAVTAAQSNERGEPTCL